jgi:hypothetical protein
MEQQDAGNTKGHALQLDVEKKALYRMWSHLGDLRDPDRLCSRAQRVGKRRWEIGEVSLKIQNYVALLAHLTEGAVSAQDLADLTGLHLETTRDFLKEMHKRKLVHIAQWDTKLNRRIKLPMYKLGEGIDKPKPPRLSSAETTKRYRQRQKIKEKFDPFYALCRHNLAVPQEADHV